MSFHVSVIIPVYNAQAYLDEAVASALQQLETAEVLLVEDGSPDNALALCQAWAQKDPRVRILRHPNGENRGAGPSRTLGIQQARCEIVAFLDADDFYLPQCFATAKQILTTQPHIDGVYGALGVHFDSEAAREQYGHLPKYTQLTTLEEVVPPEKLFEYLGTCGGIHLNTVVLRKRIFEKSGYFNTLRLSQDTHLLFRLAAVGLLAPGSLTEPVAMRRVHLDNRVHALHNDDDPQNIARRAFMFLSLALWGIENQLSTPRQLRLVKLFVKKLYNYQRTHGPVTPLHRLWWYRKGLAVMQYSLLRNARQLQSLGQLLPQIS